MDSQKYKELASYSNVLKRGTLKVIYFSIIENHIFSKPKAAEALKAILDSQPVPKPSGHTGGKDDDLLIVWLEQETIEAICNELCDLEVAGVGKNGETTPEASYYANLLDIWGRQLEEAGPYLTKERLKEYLQGEDFQYEENLSCIEREIPQDHGGADRSKTPQPGDDSYLKESSLIRTLRTLTNALRKNPLFVRREAPRSRRVKRASPSENKSASVLLNIRSLLSLLVGIGGGIAVFVGAIVLLYFYYANVYSYPMISMEGSNWVVVEWALYFLNLIIAVLPFVIIYFIGCRFCFNLAESVVNSTIVFIFALIAAAVFPAYQEKAIIAGAKERLQTISSWNNAYYEKNGTYSEHVEGLNEGYVTRFYRYVITIAQDGKSFEVAAIPNEKGVQRGLKKLYLNNNGELLEEK